ncbi:MAG: Cthe_2314 family HEPN domain-containing protein [Bacilli bacterium]|nr:Cthe_2314 family HEPN domain-containing protein [Bacilli bacterium]MDD4705677.1 Cthe_2314 family HEPN domain-containing protein [Bacilli bacterium]
MGDKNFDKIYIYNHFLQSTLDLAKKAKESIMLAMDYCKRIKTKFNPFNNNLNDDEYKCYYYLENALYRLEMLWDSLAQLYNLYAETNLDIDKIYYKNLFKNLYENKQDLFNVIEIFNYIFEEASKDETNIDVVFINMFTA